MTSTFPPNVTEGWTKMVEKWENNPKAPNPYKEPQCGEILAFRAVYLLNSL